MSDSDWPISVVFYVFAALAVAAAVFIFAIGYWAGRC